MSEFEPWQPRTGDDRPCFIIAEAGVNHNGDLERAFCLIDAAAEAGADAVKFQTFRAAELAVADAPKAAYQQQATPAAESQRDMLRKLELSRRDFELLCDRCRQRGIMFLSTPFDEQSADFLDRLGMQAIKVPSGEITNLPFLRHLAGKGKPLIMSTGMCSLGDVETAVSAIERAGATSFILLHCVSNYPASPADVNLRAMLTLKTAFAAQVGYSDHTLGIEIALAAAALGACVIEKHFTLDRRLPGPDHQASLEPAELKAMVDGIRKVESALGDGRKRPVTAELNTAAVARRSVVAARDLEAGFLLGEESLALRRPGTGLPAAMLPYILGRRLRTAVRAGTLITWDLLQ